jgi:hypothetical protein
MKKQLMLVLLAVATAAEACECVPRTPKERFDSADVVFVGKVVALTQRKDDQGRPPVTTASMQVERSWKGLRGIRTQVRDTGTDCRVGFEVGVRYLVYTRQGATVNSCTGTRKADSAVDVINALGPSIPLK